MSFEASCKSRKRTFLLLGAFFLFPRSFPCFFAFLRPFVALFYDELFFAPIFVVLKRCFSVSARFQAESVPKNPDWGRKMFHVKQKQENKKREESIRQARAGEESAREETARKECTREAQAEGASRSARRQNALPIVFTSRICGLFGDLAAIFACFCIFLRFFRVFWIFCRVSGSLCLCVIFKAL